MYTGVDTEILLYFDTFFEKGSAKLNQSESVFVIQLQFGFWNIRVSMIILETLGKQEWNKDSICTMRQKAFFMPRSPFASSSSIGVAPNSHKAIDWRHSIARGYFGVSVCSKG